MSDKRKSETAAGIEFRPDRGGSSSVQLISDQQGAELSDESGLASVPKTQNEVSESALVSAIFFRNHESGETHSCLGIDPHSLVSAPFGKSFRVDVSALDDIPLSLVGVLRFLRELDKLFPGRGQATGVLTNKEEGCVIFLPTPRDSDGPSIVVADFGHEIRS